MIVSAVTSREGVDKLDTLWQLAHLKPQIGHNIGLQAPMTQQPIGMGK